MAPSSTLRDPISSRSPGRISMPDSLWIPPESNSFLALYVGPGPPRSSEPPKTVITVQQPATRRNNNRGTPVDPPGEPTCSGALSIAVRWDGPNGVASLLKAQKSPDKFIFYCRGPRPGPKALTNNAPATTANKKINGKANIFTPRLPNPRATAPGRLGHCFCRCLADSAALWPNCISNIIFICRSGSYNHVHSSLAECEYK